MTILLGGTFLLLLLGLVAVIVLLRILYSVKGFPPLPATKPAFCLLPKYTVPLVMDSPHPEALAARLAEFGFRVTRSDAGEMEFSRGHVLSDISIKIIKVIVVAKLPMSNPVQLEVRYGHLLGVFADTGDLWAFCSELTQKVEARDQLAANANRPDSDNPYQAPLQ